MSEVKDPAIKLFGKTIQLPDTAPPPVSDSVDQPPPPSQTSDGDPPPMPSSPYSSVEEHKEQESDKDSIAEGDGKEQDGAEPMISEEPTNPSAISTVSNSANSPDSKAAPDEGLPKVAIDDDQSTEEGQNETSDSQEKTLKKPDKILPCPRCNSMDTKFCYYNNYNVNQPRHFCKNCQRYWTAGGTMRNVPVGAGRRKNKYSASHYRQIAVSEALQNISPNEIHHPGLKTNGTVLTFGSDSPLCESMTSALNISGKTLLNVSHSGFQKPGEHRPSASYKAKDIADDPQSGSSVTASSLKDEIVTPSLQNSVNQTCHSFPPQVPCFPGAPWPYPWNVSQWNAPVAQVPPPGFCAVPMPFYPAAPYWGCNVPVPGPWNVQWINPTSLSGNHSAPSSGPNSPTLGKHSRDENMPNLTNSLDEVSIKEHIPEKNLWVPKTLRIDDPGEAAKSSIWATLGIKNEGADSDCGRSMFKSFQSKDNERCHLSKSSSVLHANPAAMSRSQSFRETT